MAKKEPPDDKSPGAKSGCIFYTCVENALENDELLRAQPKC
jgi:hypothetical protein